MLSAFVEVRKLHKKNYLEHVANCLERKYLIVLASWPRHEKMSLGRLCGSVV